jgi:hypothetical protein
MHHEGSIFRQLVGEKSWNRQTKGSRPCGSTDKWLENFGWAFYVRLKIRTRAHTDAQIKEV